MKIAKITKIAETVDNHHKDKKDNKDSKIKEKIVKIIKKILDHLFKMTMKTCAICGKSVQRGTGTHFAGRLVHLKCVPMAETMWFKMGKKRK